MRKPSFFTPGGTSLCVIVALFLMVGCATFQIGQPQLQTYTFNYNGQEYSALLPEEVPLPPEKAQFYPEYYPGGIYAMHVSYMSGNVPDPRLPVATFWFTEKLGVVALVWHTLKPDGTKKHLGWLYDKGLPVPTNREAFEAFMDELAGK